MDRNTLLAFVLSMGVLTLWFIWKAQTMPPRQGAAPGRRAVLDGGVAGPVDDAGAREGAGWGSQEARPPGSVVGGAVDVEALASSEAVRGAVVSGAAVEAVDVWERTFEMGQYRATFTNRGGGLSSWLLTDYFEQGAEGEKPIELLQLDRGLGAALGTPFRELGLGELGSALYRVEGQDEESVSFVLERGGVTVRKQYRVAPDYGFELAIEVYNGTDRTLRPRFEVEWPAAVVAKSQDFRELSLVAYDGREGVTRELVRGIGSPGFFGRLLGRGADRPTEIRSGVKWAGVDIRYFVSVLMAGDRDDMGVVFRPVNVGKVAAAVVAFEPVELPPGQRLKRQLRGFAGPKRSELLAAVGSELTRSVNLGYSWVEPLTVFFQWVLKLLYRVVPNYGVAIIVITVLVRVVTLPIMVRQMKSTEKMRALQPELKQIQAKYADDRARQSEAMMALYREHGVNPLGGCLPMLLQLPVFIGLFYALQSSFALRSAPFVSWIDDLSAPEVLFEIPGIGFPVRLLPLIMGGSMVLQQKMTPMTMDAAQARMMLVMMPVMMTVLFYQFPSGLVLYWMVSNLLGIAHQLWVRRELKRVES